MGGDSTNTSLVSRTDVDTVQSNLHGPAEGDFTLNEDEDLELKAQGPQIMFEPENLQTYADSEDSNTSTYVGSQRHKKKNKRKIQKSDV